MSVCSQGGSHMTTTNLVKPVETCSYVLNWDPRTQPHLPGPAQTSSLGHLGTCNLLKLVYVGKPVVGFRLKDLLVNWVKE